MSRVLELTVRPEAKWEYARCMFSDNPPCVGAVVAELEITGSYFGHCAGVCADCLLVLVLQVIGID